MTYQEKGSVSLVKFLLNNLKNDYAKQYEDMEDFVRWNLPEETALEWIDALGAVDILKKSNLFPDEFISLLYQIIENFDKAFDIPDNPVWTHEAMKTHPFWENMRSLAKQALDIVTL